MKEPCPTHAPRHDPECAMCIASEGMEIAARRLRSAANKWGDASARDPEEVDVDTRVLRVKLLDHAWAYRQACREYAESIPRDDGHRSETEG